MNRQQNRYEALNIAHLSGASIARQQVVVRDISKTGASIMTSSLRLAPDEVVSLDFGDGDVKDGAVRWISDAGFGISFFDKM